MWKCLMESMSTKDVYTQERSIPSHGIWIFCIPVSIELLICKYLFMSGVKPPSESNPADWIYLL